MQKNTMKSSNKENRKMVVASHVLKPSPNEEEAILKGVLAERKKQRLLQVRKQHKQLSGKVLNAVKSKRAKEVNAIKMQLQDEWERKVACELKDLEKEYENRINTLGEGHRSVSKAPESDMGISQELMNQRAKERHKEAMRKLAEQRASSKMMEEEKAKLRLKVATDEHARAAMMASRPQSAPDFVLKQENKSRGSTVSSRSRSIDTFSSTRFHMPIVYAEKADQVAKVDARVAAKEHEERVLKERELHDKDLNERKEKANLRHQHARQQVLLDQSKDRLLIQLEDLEYKDRVRRQQVLKNIPKQVFQPPYQRVEDARSRQVVLEEAFENAHKPKRDARSEELLLDLDSNLDITGTDFLQPTETIHAKMPSRLQEDVDHLDASPSQTATDHNEDEISESPAQAEVIPEPERPTQSGVEPSKKLPRDHFSRMKSLLSRIRKQQEDWTKRKAERKNQIEVDEDFEDENGQHENASQTTGSLVSADIESARFAGSSGGESVPDEKDDNEPATSQEQPEKNVNSKEGTPEKGPLLHPFEQAKLVRSANAKEGNKMGVGQSAGVELSSDFEKRKKTLENQKYLLKIQRQRFENELLKQNLKQTGKELDDLIKGDDENSATLEVVVEQSQDSASESSLGVEEISVENDRNGVTISGQNTLLTAKDLTFLSGLSASQQTDLARRYPNIVDGLLANDGRPIAGGEQEKARHGETHSSAASTTTLQSNTSDVKLPPGKKAETRLSKSGVDYDRIRKYQEQLLEKQKWLRSRQEVMQKRYEPQGKDLGRFEKEGSTKDGYNGNHGSENSREVSNAQPMSGGAAHREDPTEARPKIHDDLMDETLLDQLKRLGADHDDGKGLQEPQQQGIAEDYEADTEASLPDLATLLSEATSLNQRQSVYEQLRELSLAGGREHSHRQTNSITELIPQLDQPERQDHVKELHDGAYVSGESSSVSGSRAAFDAPRSRVKAETRLPTDDVRNDVSRLLASMDSLPVIGPAAILESHDSKAHEDIGRKSQRLVSGKPTFSPIQEVEETSFRERSIENRVPQGTASISSLTEQEQPISIGSSSARSNGSLRNSGSSTGRSDASSRLSFHELISNFTETEFLRLPSALGAVNTGPIREAVLERHSQSGRSFGKRQMTNLRSSFDDWTPLVAEYSDVEKRESRGMEGAGVLGNNSGLGDGKRPLKVQEDLFAFDEEKYRQIVREKLSTNALGTELEQYTQARFYDPSQQDLFSPIKLQSTMKGISSSSVPASHGIEKQDQGTASSVSASSMQETSPVLTENSPPSSVTSKVSSTNMTRYEEVLEKVRMLPYQHQKEYEALVESYRSWRKEAVEPLLHPDVVDPFSGYELFSAREHNPAKRHGVNEIMTETAARNYQTNNSLAARTSQTTYKASHERPVKHPSPETRPSESQVTIYEPVRDMPEDALGTQVTSKETRDDFMTWQASEFMGVGTLPDGWDVSKSVGREAALNVTPNDGDSSTMQTYSDEDYVDIPGAFVADQLMEQKLFEGTGYVTSPASTGTPGTEKPERSTGKTEESNADGADLVVKAAVKEPRDHQDEVGGLLEDYTSPADLDDIEMIQSRYLDNYLSNLIKSSATNSSFTNSSSQRTKSQFSSEFRSDETVSELVRLWPSSRTTMEEARDPQPSSAADGRFNRVAPETGLSRASVPPGSSGETSSGFKDPNDYDITVPRLPKSRSDKATISGHSSKSTSFKDESDSSFSMLSMPKFASTRIGKLDRPSSPSFSETSFEPLGDDGMNKSLLSNFDYDADLGHSETSWLLPSESLRRDASPSSSAQPDGPDAAKDNVVDSSSTSRHSASSVDDQLHLNESADSTNSDHFGENSHDDVISTWTDLLAKEAPVSSAKESDADLPETVKLKRDAFMKRSKERLHSLKDNAANREKRIAKFRADGKVEGKPQKAAKAPPGSKDAQARRGTNDKRTVQGPSRTQPSAPKSMPKKNPTKQEIMKENRQKMKQFEKKIQSSLRNRKK